MKKVRIGTFFCWLFGHKFVIWSDGEDGYEHLYVRDYCVRCGIKRDEK